MKRLQQIVIEVTEACPHACLHCYNYWREHRAPLKDPETLSRAEILDLVRKVRREAPIETVALSGGEPLLRPDLPDLVTDLVQDGLNVVVITSGALLTDKRVARFPEGSLFEITLFSTMASLHDRIAGRRGAFQRVLAGALSVRRHHCELAAAVVVTCLNAHDVGPTIELALALGANGVLLNRVNLNRITLSSAQQLAPSAEQLAAALDAADTVARETGAMVAAAVPVPPCVVDGRRYQHLHFGWCPRGNDDSYYTISHNGLVRPCNHASVILGDLRTQGFAEIVDGAQAANFWAPIPPACRACRHPLRDQCRGGCPAASHECYGTRTRWDPYVDVSKCEWPTRPSVEKAQVTETRLRRGEAP